MSLNLFKFDKEMFKDIPIFTAVQVRFAFQKPSKQNFCVLCQSSKICTTHIRFEETAKGDWHLLANIAVFCNYPQATFDFAKLFFFSSLVRMKLFYCSRLP